MRLTKLELAYLSAMVGGMLAFFYAAQTGDRGFAFIVGGTIVCILLASAAYSIWKGAVPASSRWREEVSDEVGNRILTLALVGWLIVLALIFATAALLSQRDPIALAAVALSLVAGTLGSFFLRARQRRGWVRAVAASFSLAVLAMIPVLLASGLL